MKIKEQTKTLAGKELTREISFPESLSGEGVGISYIENMYFDYEGGGNSLESIPGYRELYSFKSNINGIFKQIVNNDSQFMLIHAGKSLYRFIIDDRDSLKGLTPIATLSDTRSRAFLSGGEIFILDGEAITRVNADGEAVRYDLSEEGAYVPTLYSDGAPLEDRNILTSLCREIINVGLAIDVAYETPGLLYEITDLEKKTCAVRGAENNISQIIYVPSYKTIGGVRYKVTAVLPNAFYNFSRTKEVYFSEGILEIGEYAFMGCVSLESVYCANSIKKICPYAFFGCESLVYVGLGADLAEIGEAAFMECPDALEFGYPYTPNELSKIKGYEIITDNFIIYSERYESVSVGLKLTAPMGEVVSVKIDGAEREFEYDAERREVILRLYRPYEIEGLSCEIFGRIYEGDKNVELGVDFYTTEQGFGAGIAEPILSCRTGAVHDGVIYLSGSELYPGLLFFGKEVILEGERRLYFGARSYLKIGDMAGVSAIEKLSGKLVVFKDFVDSLGSIVYINRKNGANLRAAERYEIAESVNAGSILEVFQTDGGLHYLTGSGVYSLSESAKRARRCSSQITAEIRRGGLVTACFWQGYVALSAGANLYLGDARRVSDGEYPWYPITNVGTYINDTAVYRYAESAPDGYRVSERAGERVANIVTSVGTPNGLVYYTIENGGKYAVIPTAERTGGRISKICATYSDGELLFFGTDSHRLCVFNNDMRGEPPDEVMNDEDFDAEEYERQMGKRIHPTYYSFAGHAPRCAIVTAPDDLDLPHLAKRDTERSLGVKAWGFGKITVKLGDGEVWSEGVSVNLAPQGFDGWDFSGLTLSPHDDDIYLLSSERQSFIERQVAIFSEEYQSPFGVRSIHYRAKIQGKPKRCPTWYA